MASFHIQSSGSIRLHCTINGHRHRVPTKFKVSKWDKEERRAYGKGTRYVNDELDRIEKEVDEWIEQSPTHLYTNEQVEEKLNQIILNTGNVERRKTIGEYWSDFLEEKKLEINPRTRQRLTGVTITSYKTGWDWFTEYGVLELEQITKSNYHRFLRFLLDSLEDSTAGKYIKRLKTFFIWCDKSGLPISNEYKFWVPIGEGVEDEKEDQEKALNSEQLNRVYELKVDPVDIYVLAKKLHGKNLDARQIEQLVESVDEARKQFVAMASMGPHKETFWKIEDKHIKNGVIRYRRNKNANWCVSPIFDNEVFHTLEFANLKGGPLFKRMTSINYYLTYVKELCDLPFKITAKTARKTFGSIIWHEFDHPNKMGIILKAYGYRKETPSLRRYIGIQDEDLRQDHSELFLRKRGL